MLAPTLETTIPAEILASYGYVDPTVTRLTDGELNYTFRVDGVDTEGERRALIIQKLSPIFGSLVVRDMQVVTDKLAAEGWNVPKVVPTVDGSITSVECNDDGEQMALWRAMTALNTVDVPPYEERTPETYTAFGSLLARLHASLSTIEHTPQFKIDHFHDTNYYLAKLKGYAANGFPDEESATAAQTILGMFESLPELPAGEDQLLHGDLKTANMMADAETKLPTTFIDWDTIMLGKIWVDIGDLMRALAEDAIHAGRPFPLDELRLVAEGYRAESMPEVDSETFFSWSVTATKRIALELSARYANDIIDDNYFNYDTTRFASRRDSHMDRIATQMTIIANLNERKDT